MARLSVRPAEFSGRGWPSGTGKSGSHEPKQVATSLNGTDATAAMEPTADPIVADVKAAVDQDMVS